MIRDIRSLAIPIRHVNWFINYFILIKFFQCEREFRDYMRDKAATARSAFKELLQECKLITHKSYDTYKENSNHLKEIEEILKNDKRYKIIFPYKFQIT
jgi:hypothetical protein